MPLQASSGFGVNSVFWLRSLSDSDRGPTRRVLEDLEPFFNKISLPFQLRDVRTVSDLYRALDSLADAKVKPILQLDMHGEKDGLLLAGSGEIAPWDQVVPKFRAINIASGGNLCVVAGVCFAFYAIKQASITQASPVNVLIAPDREVQARILEDGLVAFYRTLFSGGEISAAFAQHLGDPFKLFHAERFFVIAVCKYILNSCKGKGAAKRREALLTGVLLAGQPATPENLRRIRKQIKKGIRPDQKMLDRYANTFLLGRPCPFPVDKLISAVEDAQQK
jgi:hypothetical protein